jgi:hypothetical protein
LAATGAGGLRADVALLTSWPIMMCFAFFSLYAITLVGFQTFATTALTKLYDVPLLVATTGLTGSRRRRGTLRGSSPRTAGTHGGRRRRHAGAGVFALVIATGACRAAPSLR